MGLTCQSQRGVWWEWRLRWRRGRRARRALGTPDRYRRGGAGSEDREEQQVSKLQYVHGKVWIGVDLRQCE